MAQFIGTSNTLTGTLGRGDGEWASVLIGDWTLRARRADGVTGSVLAVFRPEALSLLVDGREGGGGTIGEAAVVSREFLGAVLRYRLRLDDGALIHLDEHKPDAARLMPEGTRVRFAVRPEDVMLFPTKERS